MMCCFRTNCYGTGIFLFIAVFWGQCQNVFSWNHLLNQKIDGSLSLDRRTAAMTVGGIIGTAWPETFPSTAADIPKPGLQKVEDKDTYEALVYQPPKAVLSDSDQPPPPLLVVLHGAGRNDLDIYSDLADPKGEHAGLIPSLIASGEAPNFLLDNFAILAPYSKGKPSFYQDSRTKLLQHIEWAKSLPPGVLSFDPKRIFLFGFSDGATVAVELLTTGRFAGGIICSYGFTGTLPDVARSRLANIPIWAFHSADDVIFSVRNSDKLVQQLQQVSTSATGSSIRYNRYDKDPENLPARVRGHSMGITASKSKEVYEWLLGLSPTSK